MAEVPGTFDAGKDARFPASGAAHRRLRARMVLFLCGMLLPGVALAEEAALPVSLAAQEKLALRSQEHRTWVLNLGILAGVTAYGFSTWSWGESGFKTSSEGWFGRGTEHGGADKLGHAYTGAVVAAATGSLYRHWGYESQRAAELSALSSLLLTGAVEIGDGFSQDYGFSWEDQVSNVAGIGLEYLRQRYPALGERVQFRWEYLPSPAVRHRRHTDLTTDYSGSRYLLAFPLRAWAGEDSALRWLELQVGYGTRGFGKEDLAYFDRRTRHPFVGVGIHIPGVIKRLGAARGAQRAFEHIQVPWTALPPPP